MDKGDSLTIQVGLLKGLSLQIEIMLDHFFLLYL